MSPNSKVRFLCSYILEWHWNSLGVSTFIFGSPPIRILRQILKYLKKKMDFWKMVWFSEKYLMLGQISDVWKHVKIFETIKIICVFRNLHFQTKFEFLKKKMKIWILGNCFFLKISSISYFWKILILEILHVLKNFWPRKHFWNCLNFLNVFRIFVINNDFSKIRFFDDKKLQIIFLKEKDLNFFEFVKSISVFYFVDFWGKF